MHREVNPRAQAQAIHLDLLLIALDRLVQLGVLGPDQDAALVGIDWIEEGELDAVEGSRGGRHLPAAPGVRSRGPIHGA